MFSTHSQGSTVAGNEEGDKNTYCIQRGGNGWGGHSVLFYFNNVKTPVGSQMISLEPQGQSVPHNILIVFSSFPVALPIFMDGHWVHAKYLCPSYPELQLITVAKEQQCKFPRQCNFPVVKLNRIWEHAVPPKKKKKKHPPKAVEKMRIGWAYSYLLYNCHRE